MDVVTIISTMKKCSCFAHLTDDQIKQLIEIGRFESFKRGDVIVKEKEQSTRLYLILSGEVQIQKKLQPEEMLPASASISSLKAGDILGEISFIDNSPRTATAIAQAPSSSISWTVEEIERQIPEAHHVVQLLKNNIMLEVADRFRMTNKKYVDSLRKHLEIAKEQIEFGRLFLMVVLLLGINSIVVRLIAQGEKFIDPYSLTYSWIYLLIIISIFLVYIRFDMRKLKEFGVTTIHLKKSILHGCFYSVLLVTIMLGALYGYSILNPAYSIARHIRPENISSVELGYLAHAYLQEFIARGILLGSLCQFYRDKPIYFPIFIASFLFGVFHFSYGIWAAVITFLSGIVFSIIYLKDKNLVGVTLVHATTGWLAFFVGLI